MREIQCIKCKLYTKLKTSKVSNILEKYQLFPLFIVSVEVMMRKCLKKMNQLGY